MTLRNKAYDWGAFAVERVGVPVISVGNITAGGTGKTPLVEYIVRHLLARGKRVGVVSRGYRRRSSGVIVVSDGTSVLVDAGVGGDEPVQIAEKFPGAVVVVGEDKVDAARRAASTLGVEIIVVDDGFQHRALRRDLDILVLDSTKDIMHVPVLPAGTRREPLRGMRRADLVALSKCDPDQTLPVWTVAIRRWFAGTLVKFRHATLEVRRATDHAPVGVSALNGKSVFAFSGIGDHESFVRGLAGLGCVVRGERRFPDHHRYTERDIGMLAAALKTTASEMFITTEKDVMRLEAEETMRRSFLEPLPVFYATVSVEILEGASVLTSAIDRCLKGGAN